MSYVAPPTFTAATTAAAADVQVLSDDIAWLKAFADAQAGSGVSLLKGTSTSIATATYTTLSWVSAPVDITGWWTSGTDIVVPAGAIPAGATTIGIHIDAMVKFAANASGARQLRMLNNGTAFWTGGAAAIDGSNTMLLTGGTVTTVAAADVITIEANQSSGGSLNVTEARVAVARLGVAS